MSSTPTTSTAMHPSNRTSRSTPPPPPTSIGHGDRARQLSISSQADSEPPLTPADFDRLPSSSSSLSSSISISLNSRFRPGGEELSEGESVDFADGDESTEGHEEEEEEGEDGEDVRGTLDGEKEMVKENKGLLVIIPEDRDRIDMEEEMRLYEQFRLDSPIPLSRVPTTRPSQFQRTSTTSNSIHQKQHHHPSHSSQRTNHHHQTSTSTTAITPRTESIFSYDIWLGDNSGCSKAFARGVDITGWTSVGDEVGGGYVVYDITIHTSHTSFHIYKRFSAFLALYQALMAPTSSLAHHPHPSSSSPSNSHPSSHASSHPSHPSPSHQAATSSPQTTQTHDLRPQVPKPPKKNALARYRKGFLEGRRKGLERWLRGVMLHPEIGGVGEVRGWVSV